ncbi:hypothetical protein SD81_030330 [Tolypothrix campylonemoides VB511288]|nr:hypothetical protein SD81_030330 [Tolypothrix campylonemoides VB511288]
MKQVVRQLRERNKIDLHSRGINYHLWSLDTTEYKNLRSNSLPIADDYSFYIELYLFEREKEDRLNLAELFVTLEWLFGESSDFFDDWKGSFCFPILLVVKKAIGDFFYLMRIYDHRGTVYFSIYRILENGRDDYDTDKLREPFALEFSRQEINYFFSFLYGYITGYFQSLKQNLIVQPFLKKVDSNLIVYGYKDGEYFEKQYDSPETYQAAIQSFEEIYGSCLRRTDVNTILKKIISDV